MRHGQLVADTTLRGTQLPHDLPVGLPVIRLDDGTWAVPAVKVAVQLEPDLPLEEQIFRGVTGGIYNASDSATCRSGTRWGRDVPDDHTVPHPDCSCGFYAVSATIGEPLRSVPPARDRQHASAVLYVALSGRVLAFERVDGINGFVFRAEHQRVLSAEQPRRGLVGRPVPPARRLFDSEVTCVQLPAHDDGEIDEIVDLFAQKQRPRHREGTTTRAERDAEISRFLDEILANLDAGSDGGPTPPPRPFTVRRRPDDPPLAARQRLPVDRWPGQGAEAHLPAVVSAQRA